MAESSKESPAAGFLHYLDFQGNPAQTWKLGTKPLVVGRGDFASACVLDDSLSRSHFMVVREAGEYFLVDLDSQNGTWVNGSRVSGQRLCPGELIRAGKSLFLFCEGSPASETASVLASVQALLDAEQRTCAAA